MKAKTRFTLDMVPGFQRRLKVTAALKGVTMREYCLAAIEKELVKDEALGVTTLPFSEEALNRLEALKRELFGERRLAGDSVGLIRETRKARAGAL